MTDATAIPANIVGIPDGAMLQNLMGQINGNPGPRQVPGRTIPVPTPVSADLQTAIAMPYRNSEWLLNPPDAQGWKDAVADLAHHSTPAIEQIIDKLGVTVHQGVRREPTDGGQLDRESPHPGTADPTGHARSRRRADYPRALGTKVQGKPHRPD